MSSRAQSERVTSRTLGAEICKFQIVLYQTNSQWSTTERQTIEEIYEIVDGALHLTFDYLAFTFGIFKKLINEN
eukprot:529425-Amorphochlora_amoeboformis.AAC.1